MENVQLWETPMKSMRSERSLEDGEDLKKQRGNENTG